MVSKKSFFYLAKKEIAQLYFLKGNLEYFKYVGCFLIFFNL